MCYRYFGLLRLNLNSKLAIGIYGFKIGSYNLNINHCISMRLKYKGNRTTDVLLFICALNCYKVV